MEIFITLYKLAKKINGSWEDNNKIDRTEAEQLVCECQKIPENLLAQIPELGEIIAYSKGHDNWDSKEVANWPQIVCEAIAGHTVYHYRPEGETWEVYSMAINGEQEWKASVETEAIAEKLVKLLAPKQMAVEATPSANPIQELANQFLNN